MGLLQCGEGLAPHGQQGSRRGAWGWHCLTGELGLGRVLKEA